ncbi:c-type cytochrome [Methylocapsa acidiphila]|uniref:c-type cytochrome n=1 Tax=Methylocapsa acidiphila TaxID=133552 RepID=UPI00040DDCFB|nr:cytochrome c [Methylocapsa acidiphila]
MSRTSSTGRKISLVAGVFVIVAGLALSAQSQTPPAGAAGSGPSPARQAIESRKAVFTLIGNNFRLIGNVLKGAAPYDAAAVQKSISRLVFLADLIGDSFPEISNIGEPDTKAKLDIWTNRADFDKKVKEFQTHLASLQQVASAEAGPTDAFKTAATAVAQDCKGCHDDYKAK